MGDENDVALALNVAIGIALYLIMETRSLSRRLLMIAALGVMLAGVVVSNSRGGYVGLAVLILYSLIFAPNRRLIAVFVVAYIMTGLAKLQSSGNVSLDNAVGTEARVYLRIPAARGGAGKVTVAVQGRSIECKAMTAGPEIPTGAQVRVVAAGSDTVEVQLIETE